MICFVCQKKRAKYGEYVVHSLFLKRLEKPIGAPDDVLHVPSGSFVPASSKFANIIRSSKHPVCRACFEMASGYTQVNICWKSEKAERVARRKAAEERRKRELDKSRGEQLRCDEPFGDDRP